jgi:hypothetical protein
MNPGFFQPGALLAQSYPLPRGPRVRLRLAQSRDAEDIVALFALNGLEQDRLEVAKLLRSSPRDRIVICATALIGSTETVVGVGAIRVGASEPDILLADTLLTSGLPELLASALAGRSEAIAKRLAA